MNFIDNQNTLGIKYIILKFFIFPILIWVLKIIHNRKPYNFIFNLGHNLES